MNKKPQASNIPTKTPTSPAAHQPVILKSSGSAASVKSPTSLTTIKAISTPFGLPTKSAVVPLKPKILTAPSYTKPYSPSSTTLTRKPFPNPSPQPVLQPKSKEPIPSSFLNITPLIPNITLRDFKVQRILVSGDISCVYLVTDIHGKISAAESALYALKEVSKKAIRTAKLTAQL